MMTDQPKIVLKPAASGKRSGDSLAGMARNAALGGQHTKDLFFTQDLVGQLSEQLAEGNATWVQTTNNENGQPAFFAELNVGDGKTVNLSIVSNIDENAAIGQGTNTETFEFGGVTYHVIGYYEFQFQGPAGYYWAYQVVAGTMSFFAAKSKVSKFITSMIKRVMAGANKGLGTIGQGINSDDANVRSSDADRSASDEVVKTSGSDDVAAAWGSFIGWFAAVIVAYVVTDLILHKANHRFVIYNLTDADVTWALDYQQGNTAVSWPAKNISTDPENPEYVIEYVIQGRKSDGKGGFDYYDGALRYVSQALANMGYVFSLMFADPNSENKYTATFMFDVPYAGDNSLAATFDTVTDAEAYYSDNAGENKQLSLSATSTDGKYKLTLTYDMLSGTQLPPYASQEAFWYNSVVVLETV